MEDSLVDKLEIEIRIRKENADKLEKIIDERMLVCSMLNYLIDNPSLIHLLNFKCVYSHVKSDAR